MPITAGKGERRRVIHKRRLLDELRRRARSEHLGRRQLRDGGQWSMMKMAVVGTMTGGVEEHRLAYTYQRGWLHRGVHFGCEALSCS